MKKLAATFIISFFLFNLSAFAQGPEYYRLVDKADSLFKAKHYKESAEAYREAFNTLSGKADPDDRYNAARSWAMAGIADSAMYHLEYLADKKYLPYSEVVFADSCFQSLHATARWKKFVVRVNASEAKLNKALVKQLDSVLVNDQKYRLEYDSLSNVIGNDTTKMNAFYKEWHNQDSLDLIIVKGILDKYGWLGPDVVGNEGNSALFLVIQHSDPATMDEYLPMMKEAVKNGNAKAGELALLIDRTEMNHGRPQIYGSQITVNNETGKSEVYKIIDEKNVNKRRAEVGLGPMEDYAKYFGIEYHVPEK
jgi:hypothetical protein